MLISITVVYSAKLILTLVVLFLKGLFVYWGLRTGGIELWSIRGTQEFYRYFSACMLGILLATFLNDLDRIWNGA